MEDNKLIFWTGAPGSKWSATAWCLSKTKKLDIDISDRYRSARAPAAVPRTELNAGGE